MTSPLGDHFANREIAKLTPLAKDANRSNRCGAAGSIVGLDGD
jgi:hypothetical protein